MTATTTSGYGQQTPGDSNSLHNAIVFIIRQKIAELDTAKLVQVAAVHGGGVEPSGTVDVIPLVSQVDGNGNAMPHGTVYGLPWSRTQGGDSAVICDPQVDDIGYVVACDRDISNVKSSLKASTPGSYRKFNVSDGIYAGGCLCVAPKQYLIFTSTGVRLVDRYGNSFSMGQSGISFTDLFGNKMITGAGFVNFVTSAFQVNGVPVTIP